jgi:glycosyltransferase involved in cell wall biosynthesis
MKVGMISIYPPPASKHAALGGVASYTRNLVVSLLDKCEVVVFANKLPNIRSKYREGATVYRCWSKGLLYPFQIFRKVASSKVDIVHVQHEIYLYGGLGSAIIFPLLLFLIKLLRKPVVVTLHGVLPLSEVNGRFLRDNWIRGSPLFMKAGLILLVKLIVLFSTAVIVHEEKFKEVLKSEYNCPGSKIYVIHHGIEERNDLIEKNKAKQILCLSGKNVILFFGYITGYKNVELLIESASFLKTPDWVIVIAGGPHPRLSTNPNYRRYLSDLREKALAVRKEGILFRGFIAEEEIPLYFSAADLIVFPYKICMHASGPLSLSISYGKPFLISDDFKGIFACENALFKNEPKDLTHKIDRFFEDKKLQLQISAYIRKFKKERLWSVVSDETWKLFQRINKRSRVVRDGSEA